jgi:hypothetical protein
MTRLCHLSDLIHLLSFYLLALVYHNYSCMLHTFPCLSQGGNPLDFEFAHVATANQIAEQNVIR